jgi:hypothetical protein
MDSMFFTIVPPADATSPHAATVKAVAAAPPSPLPQQQQQQQQQQRAPPPPPKQQPVSRPPPKPAASAAAFPPAGGGAFPAGGGSFPAGGGAAAGVALGQDVSHLQRFEASIAELHVGRPVGVLRSNRAVTAGLVVPPLPGQTPPGAVRVQLDDGDGGRRQPLHKDVPGGLVHTVLFTLAAPVAVSAPPPPSSPAVAGGGVRVGEDVSRIARAGGVRAVVGGVVGVLRSNGAVTAGVVARAGPDTRAGWVRVVVSGAGATKDVPPDHLFALPPY